MQFPSLYKYLGIHILLGSLISLQYVDLRSDVTCVMPLTFDLTKHQAAPAVSHNNKTNEEIKVTMEDEVWEKFRCTIYIIKRKDDQAAKCLGQVVRNSWSRIDHTHFWLY